MNPYTVSSTELLDRSASSHLITDEPTITFQWEGAPAHHLFNPIIAADEVKKEIAKRLNTPQTVHYLRVSPPLDDSFAKTLLSAVLTMRLHRKQLTLLFDKQETVKTLIDTRLEEKPVEIKSVQWKTCSFFSPDRTFIAYTCCPRKIEWRDPLECFELKIREKIDSVFWKQHLEKKLKKLRKAQEKSNYHFTDRTLFFLKKPGEFCGYSLPAGRIIIGLDRVSKQYTFWHLADRSIGEGSFRKVHAVQQLLTGEQQVFKYALTSKATESLHQENSLLTQIHASGPCMGIQAPFERSVRLKAKSLFTEGINPSVAVGYLMARYTCDGAAYLANPHLKTESELLQFMYQLITALKQLHERGIAHGDLKPSNILIKKRAEGITVDLTDLESAWYFPIQGGEFRQSTLHTRCYCVLSHREQLKSLLEQGDVEAAHTLIKGGDRFALGLILFELLTGIDPCPSRPDPAPKEFCEDGDFQQLRRFSQLIKKKYHEKDYPVCTDPKLAELMKRLLQEEVDEQWTMSKVWKRFTKLVDDHLPEWRDSFEHQM